jgi:hypothetical protein
MRLVAAVPALAMALVVLVTTAQTAGATPICHWVDTSGRTHFAAAAPDAYRATAKCTDSRKDEISPARHKAAAARADERKARVQAEAKTADAGSADPAATVPDAPAPRQIVKRPTELVTKETDCPTWRRLFDESANCFGPFRTTRGAIKVEAFDFCNEVPSPVAKCGPVSN